MANTLKFLYLFMGFVLHEGFLSAQNIVKPFPQHLKYSAGVIIPGHISQQQLDDSVRSFYDQWKERYIKKDAGDGQLYIGVDGAVDNKQCVSEGQGYGMMIVALMAGYDKAAQKTYDGLYHYYKHHPSNKDPFLMAWAQTAGFKDADGSSASDGDMDIAYSLLIANAQWGSNGHIDYIREARSMILTIQRQEINAVTFSVLLSNAVEPDSKDYFDMRSSDFMPAHFRTFSNVTKDSVWDKVIKANYSLFSFMQKKYSSDAGVLPDFIQHINHRPEPAMPNYLESKYDGSYNYNACRVPWRIATDFIINGDKRAKAITEKINTWIRETTQNNPDNISAGYTLGGDDLKKRNFEAMSFIGSFAVAAMIDSKNQNWLNQLWDYIVGFNLDQYDYYDNTIKMIDLIILSGNYWDPSG